MGKTALVVSGGGGKGAFAVGAAAFLALERGIQFDLYAGTSTGSIIAAAMAASKLPELVTTYGNVSSNQLFAPQEAAKILKSPGVFNSAPLRKLLERVFDQAAADLVLQGTHPIFLTTVSLQTGELVYFHTADQPSIDRPARQHRLQNRAELIGAILASSSVPVMLPAVMVLPAALDPVDPPLPVGAAPEAIVADEYVDGGVREYAPLKVAIDQGATDIYAVILSPLVRTRINKSFGSVLGVLPRAIDVLTEDVAQNDIEVAERYNSLLAKITQLRRELIDQGVSAAIVEQVFAEAGPPFSGKVMVNLRVIAPEMPLLKGDSLVFDQTDMQRMMNVGRLRAETVLGP
jgi:NTE family protein